MMLSTVLLRNQVRCLQHSLCMSYPMMSSAASNNTFTLKAICTGQMTPLLKTPAVSENAITRFSTSSVVRSQDHVKLWTAEKVVTILNYPVIALPLLYTTPLTDAIFCTVLVLHFHWGIEAIVIDYIRPSLFHFKTLIPNIAQACVWVLSALTLGGLYYFNYTDVGLVNAIKMLWKL